MKSLIDYLLQFVTESKQEKMQTVLDQRTSHFTLVLEDIFQSQNASATLRTSECLGIQHIHVIENRNAYQVNPMVVKGASKWISLHQYTQNEENSYQNNTERCFNALREQGYRIVATSPEIKGYTPETLPLEPKTAIIFGTEKLGLTDYALQQADATLRLPMFGFTQSYNISVSVAITFSRLIARLHQSDIDWQLAPKERKAILLQWLRRTVYRSDIHEKIFYSNKQSS